MDALPATVVQQCEGFSGVCGDVEGVKGMEKPVEERRQGGNREV